MVPHWRDLPFNPKLKGRARELRKAGNLAEILMWHRLRRKQLLGVNFIRQKIIGNYIVDFYCKELGIVLEIDGASHINREEYDRERDAFLEGFGLIVIRVCDVEVRVNLSATIQKLTQHILTLKKKRQRQSPLERGARRAGCG